MRAAVLNGCDKNGADLVVKDVAEPAVRIAELDESIGYIDWKQGYYDSVLSGELPYMSNLLP